MILCCGVLYVQDVEANTVRLKEHEQAVLVLEKSPRTSTLGSIKYVCFHVSIPANVQINIASSRGIVKAQSTLSESLFNAALTFSHLL